MRHFTRI